MTKNFSTSKARSRAFLVMVKTARESEREIHDLLAELTELVHSFGATTVDSKTVQIDRFRARFLIGSGNAELISTMCREKEIDVIVFDSDLTPSQQRNWEQLSGRRVIDRREVILDIFAQRASTREAELQIELARAEYMLPRLKRAWTHLSRQDGAVGLRGGEGEKQIELDERLVQRRLVQLHKELTLVRQRRAEQRKKRQKVPVPNAAIVGYTNAGKSLLLNRLTNANTLVEDKLFATLDPTTRRLRLANNQTLLLTDTVGFVRKLPHSLVEAFKATLEEAVVASFLLHVVDVTSPNFRDHIATTEQVLEEIGATNKYTFMVFNKVDLISDAYTIAHIRKQYPDGQFISARTGQGIPELVAAIEGHLETTLNFMNVRIPAQEYELVALLHRTSKIDNKEFIDDAIHISAWVPENCRRSFEKYVTVHPLP